MVNWVTLMIRLLICLTAGYLLGALIGSAMWYFTSPKDEDGFKPVYERHYVRPSCQELNHGYSCI